MEHDSEPLLDLFDEPTNKPKGVLLPPAFDMQCRNCKDAELTHVCVPFLTERKPFTTLFCLKCRSYLYLFGEVKDPLIVNSKRIQGSTMFSADIDQLFREREVERERKAKRSERSGSTE